MRAAAGVDKKIGFLSFGHWQPIPGSQVRTGNTISRHVNLPNAQFVYFSLGNNGGAVVAYGGALQPFVTPLATPTPTASTPTAAPTASPQPAPPLAV